MGKNDKYIKSIFRFLFLMFGFVIIHVEFFKQFYKGKYYLNYDITLFSYKREDGELHGLFSLERHDCGYELIKTIRIFNWVIDI